MKTLNKKLCLKKETLTNLGNGELKQVKGGAQTWVGGPCISCYITCNPNYC